MNTKMVRSLQGDELFPAKQNIKTGPKGGKYYELLNGKKVYM